MVLTGHELQKIRTKSSYDEDRGEWNIPPFFMKNKEVQLPTLGAIQGKAFIEQEKENRDLWFEVEDTGE